jgi:hypothetical protein
MTRARVLAGFVTAINVSNDLFVGVVTGTSFIGDGTGLTGVASTDYIITGTAATFNNTVEVNNNFSVSGISTFTGAVSVTGDVSATGNVNSGSDINLKTDIETVEDAISIINQIRGVRFKWKNSDQSSVGVIAQELETVLPELVQVSLGGTKTVTYNGLIGVLVQAVKELKLEIEELKRTR